MTIEMFLKMYYQQVRDVRESTIQQYSWCVLSFSKWLGRPAEIDDLGQDVVNGWIRHLTSTLSRETAKSRRMTLLSIWNAAAALGYTKARTTGIRIVKTPAHIVRSLSSEQCHAIVDVISRLHGTLFGYPKSAYLSSLVKATLETSLRQSDLHLLEWPDVRDSGGRLQIVQFKTGVRRWVFLSQGLLREISAWHGTAGLVWPRGERGTIGRILQRVGRELNLRLTHTRLRQTAITDVERQQAGAGWLFAGHASPETTRRWYTDFDRVADGLPRPSFFQKLPAGES